MSAVTVAGAVGAIQADAAKGNVTDSAKGDVTDSAKGSITDAAQRNITGETPGEAALLSQSAEEQEIRRLDRQVMFELIRLAEFNTRYEQTINHLATWRKICYPLAQEAAYAGFLGYTATDLNQRSKGWSNPRLISPTAVKRALSSGTVGALLGSTSSMIELSANGAEAWKVYRRGFSPRASLSYVHSVAKRVDEMIARRHSLMGSAGFSGARRELFELKEKLLEYEKRRLVFEFTRWCAHSRGYAWYGNTFYVINATVNMARFSALQLGFKSFTVKKCGGATGPLILSSVFLAALGPAASSAVGNLVERHQKKCIGRKLSEQPPALSNEEARQGFERLAQLLTSADAGDPGSLLAAELAHLRKEKVGLDQLVFHEERKIQRTRKVAGQMSKIVPIISTMGVTSGTLSTIGYHAFRQMPVINNRLGLAGDTATVTSEAVALALTPAAGIMNYLYERDLKKKGEHPDQLLSKRLADLKELETILSTASH